MLGYGVLDGISEVEPVSEICLRARVTRPHLSYLLVVYPENFYW